MYIVQLDTNSLEIWGLQPLEPPLPKPLSVVLFVEKEVCRNVLMVCERRGGREILIFVC